MLSLGEGFISVWQLLALGFCMMLIVEGALYALFPGTMRKILEQLKAESDKSISGLGLSLSVIGMVCLFLLLKL